GRTRLRRGSGRLELRQPPAELFILRARALLGPPALGQRLPEPTQPLLHLLEASPQPGQFFRGPGAFRLQRGALCFQAGAPLLELFPFRGDLLQPALRVQAPLLGDRQLALALGDPPGRLLQPARRGRPGARRIRGLQPQPFEVGLGRGERRPRRRLLLAQLLQAARRRLEDRPHLLQLEAGHGHFQRETARPQLAIPLRPPLLPRQAADLALDLRNEVLETRQVRLRRFQTPLCGLPPVLVAANACRFLEELPPLLRPVGQDRVHLPLLDHRVGVGAQPRVTEQVQDVL